MEHSYIRNDLALAERSKRKIFRGQSRFAKELHWVLFWLLVLTSLFSRNVLFDGFAHLVGMIPADLLRLNQFFG